MSDSGKGAACGARKRMDQRAGSKGGVYFFDARVSYLSSCLFPFLHSFIPVCPVWILCISCISCILCVLYCLVSLALVFVFPQPLLPCSHVQHPPFFICTHLVSQTQIQPSRIYLLLFIPDGSTPTHSLVRDPNCH